MIGFISKKLFENVRLKLWRRRQDTNLKLRDHFRTKYRVDVGMYSYGCFDIWRMPGPIKVGRYCSIASSVRSAPINHPTETITTHPALFEKKFGVVAQDIAYDDPLVIGDDVWIGHNAMILPGCRSIGRGAIIGAGSVVTRDVAPYSIVAGNPAKEIRKRFDPELIAALEQSRWWELDYADLKQLLSERPELVLKPTVNNITAWVGTQR